MLLVIDKSLEGAQIYAQGTRNAAKKQGFTPLQAVTVENVGRSYADLVFRSNIRSRVSFDGTGKDGHDYDLFRTLDDFKAYHVRSELADKIRSGNVPCGKVLEIADILGIEIDISMFLPE